MATNTLLKNKVTSLRRSLWYWENFLKTLKDSEGRIGILVALRGEQGRSTSFGFPRIEWSTLYLLWRVKDSHKWVAQCVRLVVAPLSMQSLRKRYVYGDCFVIGQLEVGGFDIQIAEPLTVNLSKSCSRRWYSVTNVNRFLALHNVVRSKTLVIMIFSLFCHRR